MPLKDGAEWERNDMNPRQREEFRDLVIVAMARKSWDAATTAKAAGISETTMGRVRHAQSVAPGTIGKVCAALDIEPLAEAQANEGYSDDIELVRDLVGMYLRDFDGETRLLKIRDLIKYMGNEDKVEKSL